MSERIVVGISGASGAAIGVRIVELLAAVPGWQTHLVVTPGGERTIRHELGGDALERLGRLAARRHPAEDVGAAIASGTFRTRAMVVAPCSINTLSAIAAGATGNLLVRAADVHLKERRRLVLVVRESPLHLGHIRAMAAVTEYGAIVAPPVPAFYTGARTLDDVVSHVACRALILAGVEPGGVVEWEGLAAIT